MGLVKGSIDEVDKRVHMTWVQPRVLDLQQIKGMKDRLEFWCTDVRSMEMLVEHQAHDIHLVPCLTVCGSWEDLCS